MHSIEMQVMTERFQACWCAAGNHLNRQVAGGITSWLRAHPYPPFLEHLSFRHGNQLFFVRVIDTDGVVDGPGTIEGLKTIAQACHGHACILPMQHKKLNESWQALHSGWGLVDADTGNYVNPDQLVDDSLIEMTPWELHDMAVQVVKDYLEQNGYTIMSWQGNPSVDPSLWFVGKTKEPEWVVVRVVTYPENQAQRPINWDEISANCRALGTTGHFASVALVSADQPFNGSGEAVMPLWRGKGMYFNFKGLE